MVACKGSVVVAWRRGSLRTGLVGVLAAVAMVGAVGGLWVSGHDDDVGRDAAAPADRAAMPDRRDSDGDAAGQRSAAPADRWRSGSPEARVGEAAVAEEAGAAPSHWVVKAGSGASGSTSRSGAAGTGPAGARESPPPTESAAGPSAPGTTEPPSSNPPAGATTTTTSAGTPPPDDGSGGDGGGLLGGVLDVLGLG